jgi:integrase
VVVAGKGGKARTVAVSPSFLNVIDAYREVYETGIGRRVRNTDPVVCRGVGRGPAGYVVRWGERIGRRQSAAATPSSTDLRDSQLLDTMATRVRRILDHRAAQARLGHVMTHDLRRSCAGLLQGAGVDLGLIQETLGHTSPETTRRCYTNRNPMLAHRAQREVLDF